MEGNPGTSDLVQTKEEYDEHEGQNVLTDVLDVGEEIAVDEHGILQEAIMQQGLPDEGNIEIEYIDDGSIAAEEIVLDEDGVLMEEDDIATQSLVALSRGPRHKDKTVREFIQQTVPMTGKQAHRGQPRILRRPLGARTSLYESSSRGLPRPNYPIPLQTKRLLPVATVPVPPTKQPTTQKDWREEQKRLLEIYEIYDCLPDHMKEPFRRVLESRGDNSLRIIPKRGSNQMRMSGMGNMSQREQHYAEEQMMESESAVRHVQYKDVRARHVSDNELMMTDDQEGQGMHMDDKRNVQQDLEELSDMPQLEEATPVEMHSRQVRHPQNALHQPNDAQIDVEGYDSGEDQEMRGNVEYIMDSEDLEVYDRNSMKGGYIRHMRNSQVIMPAMRDEYYGGVDVSQYSANNIMMNNESRFCPGCKMTLKRSVFYHHSRMIKKYGVCNMFTPKRFPCGFNGCDERLGTVEKLCEHMWQIHGAPTDIKTEVFHSEADFEVFLRDLEGKGGNFRMSRGNKMIKAGMVQYFRCNRMQSVSRDKTLRACDELSAYGSSPVERNEDDPFVGIGGKPCLRTEEACTAFFRKAYLPNGTIEVRFCDHHLHEDERVRLPAILKDRIFEMSRKNLPPPVIMMVLQHEREKFCQIGSAIERRIMALTPKDISNTLLSKSSARKKKKSNQYDNDQYETVSVDGHHHDQHQSSPSQSNISMDGQREHFQGSNVHGSMVVENVSYGRSNQNGTDNINRADLTELEQRMLETYEANHEKRHLRETIRTRVYALGRFIKTMNFADMSIEVLEEMSEGLKNVLDCTRIKSEPEVFSLSLPAKPIKQDVAENDDYLQPSVERKTRKRKVLKAEQNDPEVNSEPCLEANDSREYHTEDTMEQMIVEAESPISKKIHNQSRRGRPKKEAKKELPDEEDKLDAPTEEVNDEVVQLPSRTRVGRVVRPRTILDV
ncbi:unnamed protein product [Auanema sp. JU1783]|nr:unnamed protein product [Auanema sp. JU1783]